MRLTFLGQKAYVGSVRPSEQKTVSGAFRSIPTSDVFVRFGHQPLQKFSREDLLNLSETSQNAPVLGAFKKRFPVGSRLVAAPQPDHPVLLAEVVSNQGHTVEIKLPGNKPVYTVSLAKDKFLFQQNLLLNLPVLNDPAIAPEAQWRKLFESHIDGVKAEPISRNDVLYPENMAHPCGFDLFGNLFMMLNPDYRPDKLPLTKQFTGESDDALDMAVSMIPQREVDAADLRDKERGNPFWTLLNERLIRVRPQLLVPIIGEGLYERAAFEIWPDSSPS